MDLVRITALDRKRQDEFLRFVPRVFPGADFTRWRDAGFWSDGYVAYSIVENDTVVANASLTRASISVDGHRFTAFQFGAVGTLPDYRGRGLADRVMRAALDDIGGAPSFLFANDRVLDFYPRFGFRPIAQTVYAVSLPSANLTLGPHAPAFDAHDYDDVVAWYLHQANPPQVHRFGDTRAIVDQSAGILRVLDIIGPSPVHLSDILATMADSSLHTVELGFKPAENHPSMRTRVDTDAHAFIRHFPRTPSPTSRLPVLART